MSQADTVLTGEIIGPEGPGREEKVRRGFWRTLKRAARQVPFLDDVAAGYFCATDRATPARVRTTLLAALAYFVVPTDLIPDFIIGTGFADDATVLFGAISMVRSHILPRHREAARRALDANLA